MKGILTLIFGLIVLYSHGQSRLYSRSINNSSTDITAASLSGDGKTLVFLSSGNDTNEPTLHYSFFNKGWSEPVRFEQIISLPKINYKYGHFLDYDGDTFYYVNRRGGRSIYNIWVTEWNGQKWSNPKMIETPILSDKNEVSPSLTPDDQEMYFCRCEKVDAVRASGCKIYYSRKDLNGDWQEPELLPEHINFGNIGAPKILNDKTTLIYSVQEPPGDYNLFRATKTGNEWSKPEPLKFTNTPDDDIYVSMNLYGNLLLTGKRVNRYYQLHEVLVPEEYRPKNVLILDFDLIRDYTQNSLDVYVRNFDTGDLVEQRRMGTGRNKLILPEGSKYLVFFKPRHAAMKFHTQVIDVTALDRTEIWNDPIEITRANSGDEMILDGIKFKSQDPYIDGQSDELITALTNLITGHTDKTFSIDVVMTNYMEDSVQTEDLTEVLIDSIKIELPSDTLWQELDSVELDSSLTLSTADSSYQEEIIPDTTVAVPARTYELVPRYEWQVKYTYHNDRTFYEIEELRRKILKLGIQESQFSLEGKREIAVENKPERFLRIKIE